MSGNVTIDLTKHERYLKYVITMLPESAASQELNRVVLGYFAMTTLDLFGCLDKYYNEDRKKLMIDTIYSLQVRPGKGIIHNDFYDIFLCLKENPNCGFMGSNFFGNVFDPSGNDADIVYPMEFPHITMTAMCLIMLIMFGDLQLSRVNKRGILTGLKACQRIDGSFGYLPVDTETDLRFTYSACVSCYILDDWGDIDVEKMVEYIHRCQRYDYAFAMEPGCESHGSACYLAVASLWLLGRLDELRHRDELIKWLVNLQGLGFCGRPNKLEDSCYTFWIGATLKILGVLEDVVELNHVRSYVLDCEGNMGGFAKWCDCDPDPYHTHHSFYGLSILNLDQLPEIHPAFGTTLSVFRKIEESINLRKQQ